MHIRVYLYKWFGLADILTAVRTRGTGDRLTEEEEDTKEGQEVETTSGRTRRAN